MWSFELGGIWSLLPETAAVHRLLRGSTAGISVTPAISRRLSKRATNGFKQV